MVELVANLSFSTLVPLLGLTSPSLSSVPALVQAFIISEQDLSEILPVLPAFVFTLFWCIPLGSDHIRFEIKMDNFLSQTTQSCPADPRIKFPPLFLTYEPPPSTILRLLLILIPSTHLLHWPCPLLCENTWCPPGMTFQCLYLFLPGITSPVFSLQKIPV